MFPKVAVKKYTYIFFFAAAGKGLIIIAWHNDIAYKSGGPPEPNGPGSALDITVPVYKHSLYQFVTDCFKNASLEDHAATAE